MQKIDLTKVEADCIDIEDIEERHAYDLHCRCWFA